MPQIPGRRVLGERLGGYIYGTIVVLAAMIEGQEAYRDGTGHVALIVLLTTVVFWLAHVYAALARAERLLGSTRVSRRTCSRSPTARARSSRRPCCRC